MAKLCDEIESFIISCLKDGQIDISRNKLAEYFSCVPSQINYVLATRFNSSHGYITESTRGGGGFIRIIKIDLDKNTYINQMLKEIGDEVSYNDFVGLCNKLKQLKAISEEQNLILQSACNKNTLATPFKIENKLRAKIVKNVLLNLIRGDNNDMSKL